MVAFQLARRVTLDAGELLVQTPALFGVRLASSWSAENSSGRDRASIANRASFLWNSFSGSDGALLSSCMGRSLSTASRGS